MKPIKHPAEKQFMQENAYGIKVVKELILEAINAYNAVSESYVPRSRYFNLNELNDEIKLLLQPGMIDRLTNTRDKNLNNVYVRENELDEIIHIYGNYKVGARSQGELKEDMTRIYVKHGNVMNGVFDIDRLIHFGTRAATDEREPIYIFDVDMLLLRFICSSMYTAEEESFRKAIKASILNKIIAFQLDKNILSKMQETYIGTYSPINYNASTKNNNYNIINIIKSMFIYMQYYNSVNGLCDREFGKTCDEIMNLVDEMTENSSVSKAVDSAYNMLYYKLVRKEYDVPRYNTQQLDKLIQLYRDSRQKALFRNTNGDISYRTRLVNSDMLVAVTIGRESAMEMLKSFGVAEESVEEKLGLESALFSIIGAEAAIPASHPKYAQYVRATRAKLLAKLTPKQRQSYIKLENEVMKLKSDINNCRSVENQKVLVVRASSVAKLIDMEIGSIKSENEEYLELLNMLDDERYMLQDTLASRDFFKERNSMLYGRVDTRNEWGY